VVNGPISQTAAGSGLTKSAGTSKLTLAGMTANTYTGVTRVNAGSLELSKPEGVVAVPGDLQVFGGSVKVLAGGQIAANSNVTVANVGTILDLGGHAQTFASLNVTGASVNVGTAGNNGGTGPALLRVNGDFSVTGGGKLDLANNRLIVDYDPAATSPIASVRAALASAYANGAWNGPGIDSVGIAATRGLGYAEAGDVLGAGGGSFGGASVDGSAVLVRYTLSGDATLDGVVDFNDLVKLAQNYNTTIPATGSAWYRGDFNYDGMVDFNDLVKLAQNYNSTLPSEPIAGAPAVFATDLAAAFAAVPEPGALSLIACGLLLSRRRTR
jgi:autotransporter-associated beta strand protein